MDLNTRQSGKTWIVELSGRLDAYESQPFNTWLEQASERPPAQIIVNLAGVNFVDSSALSILVKGMKRCRQHNGDLVLCQMQQPVKVIFELTRLDKAFSIFESEEAALRVFP
jgi:anti-sigma B factor antagonist